jgi:hypothetical protein
MMITFKWMIRMIGDVMLYGMVNRSLLMPFVILLLLGVGLVVVAAKVSAPFIYTLF